MLLVFTLVIVYFITTLFGYIVHWCFHQSWAGKIRQSHLTHHNLYSGKDYLSESYRDAGKDNTFRLFVIPSILLFALPIVLYFLHIMPLYLVIISVIEMLFIGWLHNYLHDAFHVSNHWLNKINCIKFIFDALSHAHYVHHSDMSKNFGICTFVWDRLFHTYNK